MIENEEATPLREPEANAEDLKDSPEQPDDGAVYASVLLRGDSDGAKQNPRVRVRAWAAASALQIVPASLQVVLEGYNGVRVSASGQQARDIGDCSDDEVHNSN